MDVRVAAGRSMWYGDRLPHRPEEKAEGHLLPHSSHSCGQCCPLWEKKGETTSKQGRFHLKRNFHMPGWVRAGGARALSQSVELGWRLAVSCFVIPVAL